MFDYLPGATPLDPDEIEGLIPQHMTTQRQLNEWESANILDAEKWVHRQSFVEKPLLSILFIQAVHRRMFNRTWKWAGTFRRSNKNIGVDWPTIAMDLQQLLDDVKYQLAHQSFSIDELAVRFHHRLVLIHPFPNGNGRHGRLMTDIFLLSQGCKKFTWGRALTLNQASHVRQRYIRALQKADQHCYDELIDFVR